MASRSLSVDENAGLVTVGLPVTGTDVDVGQTLTYSLGLSGNTGTVFGINAVSGQVSIIVAGALDFEKQSVYVYLRSPARVYLSSPPFFFDPPLHPPWLGVNVTQLLFKGGSRRLGHTFLVDGVHRYRLCQQLERSTKLKRADALHR